MTLLTSRVTEWGDFAGPVTDEWGNRVNGPVDEWGSRTFSSVLRTGTGTVIYDPDTGEAVLGSGGEILRPAISIERISRVLNQPPTVALTIPTLHSLTAGIDTFGNEIAVYVDGELQTNVRPLRPLANRQGSTDELGVECESVVFSYWRDVYVGKFPKDNHIVSPHEDVSGSGAPTSWTKTSNVGAIAVVDNNSVASDPTAPKAIQLNNSEPGEDAYMYQDYTVTAALDGQPFAASGWIYVASSDGVGGNPPTFGGAALDNRGLMIQRYSGSDPVGDPQIGTLDDEIPLNQWIRVQTGELKGRFGEKIQVRCYAPDAWVVWGFVQLCDGRSVEAHNVDQSTALITLTDHLTDTTIGKEDHGIVVDAPLTGVAGTWDWPWHEHQNGLAAILGMTEGDATFDLEEDAGARALRVRYPTAGTNREHITLTKTDLADWSLGEDAMAAGNHVTLMGEGSGPARDEWTAQDNSALGGHVKEIVEADLSGLVIGRLRMRSAERLDVTKDGVQLPTFRVTDGDEDDGDRYMLARDIRPGDTITVNLNHGWAVYSGVARVVTTEYDPKSRTCQVGCNPT